MLKDLNVDQACFVAVLAKAARAQRDELLGNVAEDDLAGEMQPARGAHNPTSALGVDPLWPAAAQTEALREAVATLSPMARPGLATLMRIGEPDGGRKKRPQAPCEASLLGDETI